MTDMANMAAEMYPADFGCVVFLPLWNNADINISVPIVIQYVSIKG